MNAWPTLREWFQFGGTLALELVIVFAVAKLVALRVRSAQGRRALWQISLLAMLLVAVGELNGVRGWLRLPEKKSSWPAEKKVVVTLLDVEPDLEWFRDSLIAEAAPLATAAPKPAPRPLRWQQHAVWPALIWAMVAALILFRLLIAQVMAIALRLTSHRSSGQPCPLNAITAEGTADMAVRNSDALASCAQRIAQTLGIRRKVALLINARAIAPFTFGVWRPVIVLPTNFSDTFTPDQQDAALAHELAHVARFDSAWRCFSQFACAVLWWHPLVWLAKRELDHASELVADEASLLLADGPDRLAECLVACAKKLRRPPLTTWLGMDGGGFRSALGRRVERLLQLSPHARLSRPVPWYLRLIAPMVCAALLWLGMAAVVKSDGPRGGAWRSSILGSAFAAAAENKALIASPQPVQARAAAQPTILLKRSFNVDSNTLFQTLQSFADEQTLGRGLAARPLSPSDLMSTLRNFFMAGGIKLAEPGCAIDLEDLGRSLRLTVRATPEELNLVEKTLPVLKKMSPMGSVPKAGDARPIVISPKRQAIYDKLRSIRLNEWGPLDTRPLGEVIRDLSAAVRKADPDHQGVSLIISGNASSVDPNGLPMKSPEIDLSKASVRFGTQLKDLTVEEILNTIEKVADQKIRYSVEDWGVLISPAGPQPKALHTRFFQVDAQKFQQLLQTAPTSTNTAPRNSNEGRGGTTTNREGGISFLTEVTTSATVVSGVQKFLSQIGVDVTVQGKALFVSDKLGLLMVRATLEDLDAIEKVFEPFDIKPSMGGSLRSASELTNSLSAGRAAAGQAGDPTEQNRIESAKLVQDGKFFYEAGQLHAARTNLQVALLLSPKNQGALYYLDLVNARELAVRARLKDLKVPMDPPPNQVQETSATNLHTRFFKVDPNTLEEGLKSISGLNHRTGEKKPVFNPYDTNSVMQRVQKLFELAGVDLSAPGRAVFYKDRVGMIMVRATAAELDTIEKAVLLLNMVPPQLTIRVKVFEIAKTNSAQGFDWFLGTVLTNPPPRSRTDPNAAVPTITGILTDWQFRDVVRALEQRGGAVLLDAPEITTLSGRQALIKVVDIQYIVTELDIGETNATKRQPEILPIAEPFELGPVLDVVPYVQPDGYTIRMSVIASLKEFLGYIDPQTVQPAIAGAAQANGVTQPMPFPNFRLRQAATSAMVWDGQTLMIGAGSARNLQRQRTNGVITTNYAEKELIYFITPRLIDPAGNPLHTDDEFPERHKTVPAQRKPE